MSARGKLQDASNTHTHVDGEGAPIRSKQPQDSQIPCTLKKPRGTSPSLGQPHRAPVPPSPPVPARGPSGLASSALSRAGSAAGQPQREKTAIASLLSEPGEGGETPVGWEQGKGHGHGPRVTPGLPPTALGGTRAPGTLIPFGARLCVLTARR